MPDPWVAIDATIRRSSKMTELPNDTARFGWIVALGEAKLLRRSGSFAPGQWVEAMGRYARFRPDYIKAGLLHVAPAECPHDRCLRGRGPFPDGTLIIHDWPVHQREHAVRQATYRNGRDADSDASSDGQSDAGSDIPSRALSLSTSMSSSETQPRDGYPVSRPSDDVWQVAGVVESLVGSFPYSQGSRVFDAMADDVRKLGAEKVEAAYRALRAEYASDPMDAAGIVFGAHKRLFPIPDAPRQPKPTAKGMVQSAASIREQLDAR